MDAAQNEGQDPLADRLIRAGAAFEGSAEIAEARAMARDFLTRVQAVHGLPVSERAMGMVQLVVSELVTNARKNAPGPCLLDLEIVEGAVQPGDRYGRVPDVLCPAGTGGQADHRGHRAGPTTAVEAWPDGSPPDPNPASVAPPGGPA